MAATAGVLAMKARQEEDDRAGPSTSYAGHKVRTSTPATSGSTSFSTANPLSDVLARDASTKDGTSSSPKQRPKPARRTSNTKGMRTMQRALTDEGSGRKNNSRKNQFTRGQSGTNLLSRGTEKVKPKGGDGRG